MRVICLIPVLALATQAAPPAQEETLSDQRNPRLLLTKLLVGKVVGTKLLGAAGGLVHGGLAGLSGLAGAGSQAVYPAPVEYLDAPANFFFVQPAAAGLAAGGLGSGGFDIDCPPGYISCAGKCYKLVVSPVDYPVAKYACVNDLPSRSRLAVPRSPAENRCIASLASTAGGLDGDVWIGYTRLRGHRFIGADGIMMEYDNWAPYQPDNANGRENCVKLEASGPYSPSVGRAGPIYPPDLVGYAGGQWKDVPCQKHKPSPFVCEAVLYHP